MKVPAAIKGFITQRVRTLQLLGTRHVSLLHIVFCKHLLRPPINMAILSPRVTNKSRVIEVLIFKGVFAFSDAKKITLSGIV